MTLTFVNTLMYIRVIDNASDVVLEESCLFETRTVNRRFEEPLPNYANRHVPSNISRTSRGHAWRLHSVTAMFCPRYDSRPTSLSPSQSVAPALPARFISRRINMPLVACHLHARLPNGLNAPSAQ